MDFERSRAVNTFRKHISLQFLILLFSLIHGVYIRLVCVPWLIGFTFEFISKCLTHFKMLISFNFSFFLSVFHSFKKMSLVVKQHGDVKFLVDGTRK